MGRERVLGGWFLLCGEVGAGGDRKDFLLQEEAGTYWL